ncbi:hypothetical protein [Leptospira noguchii]|uniref:hypothetical protein n=1 Tax=Leptospira noguchii TaxID=28182 RepID=UPI001FB71800|nr:hypothetical protein [Leptospira noguchii]UOG54782.1 hypothetical protein MAL09_19360 [Leptospira noguchii]
MIASELSTELSYGSSGKLNASLPMGRSAGLEPRSVDESKSAAANSCVATKPKSTAKETKASHFPWGVRWECRCYQNSSLLRPSAPFVY